MMLLLQRKPSLDGRTFGKLFVDEQFECFTLEDEIRPPGVKVPGKTAIPPGTYQVIITYSKRFKRPLPLLVGVPNFEGVRIHSGNSEKDTEGCILVGKKQTPDMILESRDALRHLHAAIKGALTKDDKVWIQIRNAEVTA
jgi:hypothetical protein